MKAKRPRVKSIICEDAHGHPYKEYESHPFWERINKGISRLVENRDIVELTTRPYIVGYICKMLLDVEK